MSGSVSALKAKLFGVTKYVCGGHGARWPADATFTVPSGSPCWNYRLFSAKAGGYLNLAMSSGADARYITTTDKDNGIHLSEIVERIVAKSPFAEIYWSACRSLESGTATFGWSKPKYSNTLKSLGGP
jgi:hypothetical protein